MFIVNIEGLSLSGKTTLCKNLSETYTKKGYSCIYRPHGHLTDDVVSKYFFRYAMKILEKWDFKNNEIIFKYIRYGFLSLIRDYSVFLNKSESYDNIDIVFLDRHFMSHYVIADYFKTTYRKKKMPSNYYQFLLVCQYNELIERSIKRSDNHGKLTDFILSDEKIFRQIQNIYLSHIVSKKQSIIFNDDFSAQKYIESKIEELVKKL